MWFIDSFKFMSDSLSKLVTNLTKEDMKVAIKLYALNGIKDDEDLLNDYTFEDKVSILSQKNIFPYTWFDSYDRMSTTLLPICKRFKSREDCIYANVAWEVLGCKTFEDYHDKRAFKITKRIKKPKCIFMNLDLLLIDQFNQPMEIN